MAVEDQMSNHFFPLAKIIDKISCKALRIVYEECFTRNYICVGYMYRVMKEEAEEQIGVFSLTNIKQLAKHILR